MEAGKFLELQHQIRQNQDDLQTALADLENWGQEMKQKDQKLKTAEKTEKKDLPPVRNSLHTKKLRKKKAKPKADGQTNGTGKSSTGGRLSGYDYRAWDKYDVDAECEAVDGEKEFGSGSEYETDEEAEAQRRKEMADVEKRLGNDLFKKGSFGEAIESYTRAMQCDPEDHILPANRAMALLKQKKYGAAEMDCTRSIALDPTYVKAYFRRGHARMNLEKYLDAKTDFEHVLMFEKDNKVAKKELEKIDKIVNPKPESQSLSQVREGIVKPIHKKPTERSKKPLRRIQIEEIGEDPAEEKQKQKVAETLQAQSAEKQMRMRVEEDNFQKMLRGECHEHEYKHHIRKPPGYQAEKPKPEVEKPLEITELPGIPTSHLQFIKDWKRLSSSFDLLAEYVKQIPPADFKRLFGEELDADMLGDMMLVLQRYYMEENRDVYNEMLHLSQVSRFGMIVMFLSQTEKNGIATLLAYLRGKKEHTEKELSELTQKYS